MNNVVPFSFLEAIVSPTNVFRCDAIASPSFAICPMIDEVNVAGAVIVLLVD